MDTPTLPPLILRTNRGRAASLRGMRRATGSSQLPTMDLARGLSELSTEARTAIAHCLNSADERLHLAQAIPALRNVFPKRLWKVDFSRRNIDACLLREMVGASACRAVHARFPDRLDRWGDLRVLQMTTSRLTALDLTGASIGGTCLNQLLTLCPQLEYLSLSGVVLTEEAFQLKEKLLDLRVLDLTGCGGLAKEPCWRALIAAVPNVVNLTLSTCDITEVGMLQLLLVVNDKIEILSVNELGQRFGTAHLEVLASRCRALTHLDISTTRAADDLQFGDFVAFAKLKFIMANMKLGIYSLITSETLLAFQTLPALETLYIHRRITNEELARYAPWNLRFQFIRYKCPVLPEHAGAACRSATSENAPDHYPKVQLSNRFFYGGNDPL